MIEVGGGVHPPSKEIESPDEVDDGIGWRTAISEEEQNRGTPSGASVPSLRCGLNCFSRIGTSYADCRFSTFWDNYSTFNFNRAVQIYFRTVVGNWNCTLPFALQCLTVRVQFSFQFFLYSGGRGI